MTLLKDNNKRLIILQLFRKTFNIKRWASKRSYSSSIKTWNPKLIVKNKPSTFNKQSKNRRLSCYNNSSNRFFLISNNKALIKIDLTLYLQKNQILNNPNMMMKQTAVLKKMRNILIRLLNQVETKARHYPKLISQMRRWETITEEFNCKNSNSSNKWTVLINTKEKKKKRKVCMVITHIKMPLRFRKAMLSIKTNSITRL